MKKLLQTALALMSVGAMCLSGLTMTSCSDKEDVAVFQSTVGADNLESGVTTSSQAKSTEKLTDDAQAADSEASQTNTQIKGFRSMIKC